MLCLRLYNQPLTTLPVVRCRLPFAAMEKFEQLKARVNSELKVQKQWEECAWTTARNAGVGALVGVFAAMILVPRSPSLRSAIVGMGIGTGVGRGATLCSYQFHDLKIANKK